MWDSARSCPVSQGCHLILLRVTKRLEEAGLGLAVSLPNTLSLFEVVSPLSWGQAECQSERFPPPSNDTNSRHGKYRTPGAPHIPAAVWCHDFL